MAPLKDVEFEENVAVVEDEDSDGVPLPYADGKLCWPMLGIMLKG